MAFQGDCSSYPLPDLLQWVDSSRKTGSLTISADQTHRRLFCLGGQLVATAAHGLWERTARVLELAGLASGHAVLAQLRTGQPLASASAGPVRRLAQEELMAAVGELTLASGAQFHFTEDPDRGDDEWVSIEVTARELLFDALRQLDETGDVEAVLPKQARLTVTKVPPVDSVVQHVVLKVVDNQPGITLQQLWLQIGLGRGLVSRAAYDLLRAERLTVEGGQPVAVDPVAQMLENGAVLIREKQFDAASLVFAALLQRDPADRRVRAFARLAEREHAAALYESMPPIASFEVVADGLQMASLRPEERQTLEHMQAGWDVSTLVLASGQREVEALKRLEKLVRLGFASLTPIGSS
jgi:hypothetical protein